MKNNIDELKKIKELKDDYSNIEIPFDELEDIKKIAIERGKKEMSRNKSNNKFAKGAVAAALIFAGFTASVNTMPTFATSMENIPALGKLVHVLRLDKGTASGGKITDGTDVTEVTINQDRLTINLTSDGKPLSDAASYKVKYHKNPHTITVTLNGVRGFSALENFEELKKSDIVKDVYRLITLDDSTVRFVVELNGPVDLKVEEYKDPAQLVLDLKELKEDGSKIYSVRTNSYPNGEGFAMIEEVFYGIDSTRVLKDAEEKFFVEIDRFDNKEDAEEKLHELKDKYSDVEIYIEER